MPDDLITTALAGGQVPAGSNLGQMAASGARAPRVQGAVNGIGDGLVDASINLASRLAPAIGRPPITRLIRAKQEAFWLLMLSLMGDGDDSTQPPAPSPRASTPRQPPVVRERVPAPGSASVVPAPGATTRAPDPAPAAAETSEPAAPPPAAAIVPAPSQPTTAPRAAAQRASAPTARAEGSQRGTISRDLAAQLRSYLSSVLPIESFGQLELSGEPGSRAITVTVRLRARGTVRSSWTRQGVGQWAAAVGSASSQMNVSAYVLGRGGNDEWVRFDGSSYDASDRSAIDRNVRIRLTGTRINVGVDGR